MPLQALSIQFGGALILTDVNLHLSMQSTHDFIAAELGRKLRDDINRKFFQLMMFPDVEGIGDKRKEQRRDNKWVLIQVGQTQFLAWRDKKTGIVYKNDQNMEPTWERYKKYTFIRYATGFDL